MYKIRDDVTKEQLAAAVDALNPFYAFGSVLQTAKEETGCAWMTLYAGAPPKDGQPPEPDDFDNEVYMTSIQDDGCIIGINGGWDKTPATLCGPVLKASDFFEAASAFLACVEPCND